jgi:hypothetical protein
VIPPLASLRAVSGVNRSADARGVNLPTAPNGRPHDVSQLMLAGRQVARTQAPETWQDIPVSAAAPPRETERHPLRRLSRGRHHRRGAVDNLNGSGAIAVHSVQRESSTTHRRNSAPSNRTNYPAEFGSPARRSGSTVMHPVRAHIASSRAPLPSYTPPHATDKASHARRNRNSTTASAACEHSKLTHQQTQSPGAARLSARPDPASPGLCASSPLTSQLTNAPALTAARIARPPTRGAEAVPSDAAWFAGDAGDCGVAAGVRGPGRNHFCPARRRI